MKYVNLIELSLFLKSGRDNIRTTEAIAEHFKITNREVGHIMSDLKKKKLIYRYSKSPVIFSNFMSGKAEPLGFDRSLYEWIGS